MVRHAGHSLHDGPEVLVGALSCSMSVSCALEELFLCFQLREESCRTQGYFCGFSFPGGTARGLWKLALLESWRKGRCLRSGTRGWHGCQRGALPRAELCPSHRLAALTKGEMFLAVAFST